MSRPAEGFDLSPAIRLIQTPGHSAEDVSTLVDTDDGLVVATHLWWTAAGPADDPYAPDREVLRASRERVLGLPGLATIVPGHGPAFPPAADPPR